VFTIVPRTDQRAMNWVANGIGRLVDRFRSSWRTV
jgi:hypothetical protein